MKYFGLFFFVLLITALSIRGYLLKPKIWLESIAGEQTFDMAVHISAVPNTKDEYIVTTKTGKVFKLRENAHTSIEILDLSDIVKSDTTEEGMLSSVIDPQNTSDIYIYYCLDEPMRNRLSRFKIIDGLISKSTEEVLIEFNKPDTGHNAGDMKFGEDGYLWLSIGEAGYAKKKLSQQIYTDIVGSIIRIDIRNKDKGRKYAIPSSNPFVGNTKNIPEEIWAHGLRNPWRWSFISRDEIIIGDVGIRTWEEISRAKKGDHLGWPYIEGPECSRYHPKCEMKKEYKGPMTYFSRDVMRSITGGFVYHGKEVQYLQGKYIFADYLRGIMALPINNPPEKVLNVWDDKFEILFPKIPMNFGPEKGSTIHIVSFFEREDKELLAVALNGGIFRIVEIDFWTSMKSFFYMFGNFR